MTLVIGDDERGAAEARLDFLKPQDGAQFAAGTPIGLEALGIFTLGDFAVGCASARVLPLPG